MSAKCGCGLKQPCRGKCGREQEPKQRTVRAWAVVCASGKVHAGKDRWLTLSRKGAWDDVRMLNAWPHLACGPHKSAPLTATVEVRR